MSYYPPVKSPSLFNFNKYMSTTTTTVILNDSPSPLLCPVFLYFKVSLCLLVGRLANMSIFVIVFIFHMACNSNCSYYCFTDINCTAFFYSCISSVIFVVSFMLV